MLYNKTEKIICQVFFLKISKILILTYFIKNDIIINKMFHGEHFFKDINGEYFYVVIFFIIFYIIFIFRMCDTLLF